MVVLHAMQIERKLLDLFLAEGGKNYHLHMLSIDRVWLYTHCCDLIMGTYQLSQMNEPVSFHGKIAGEKKNHKQVIAHHLFQMS